MSEGFAKLNGQPLAKWSLHVPYRGAWFVDADQEDDDGSAAPGAPCVLTVATAALVGTISPQAAGTYAAQRKARIVGGGNGWGALVPGKADHNDAGIRAQEIAEALAAEVRESFGGFAPERDVIGVDFVRSAGTASRALEQAIGSAAWWVDYAGITHVGVRPVSAAPADAYEVENYNPRTHVVQMYVDDLSVGVGSTIKANLDVVETIQSFDLYQDKDRLRMVANCGILPEATTQIETLFRRIVERVVDGKLRGPYRYRVVSVNVDGRVNLQAVSARAGVPDLSCVEIWPGVAGSSFELTPGALVLVEFADDGDPTQPVVTHFRGVQDAGFVPVSLAFLKGTRRVAGQGDLVQSGGPGTIVTLMPLTGVGAPPNNAVVAGAPHMISFSATPPTPLTADPLYGAVATGTPDITVP